MAYYVPGTLSFKSFKQTAVTTSGGIAMTTLVGLGIPQESASTLLQPVTTQQHPMGNPWLNYSIYLTNSFEPCVLQLMIFLVTVFSLLQEIKTGNSSRWLANAGGSIVTAVSGKLIPQFIIFSVVGIAIQSFIYRYSGFPLNCNPWEMIVAMMLFVAASQAFALFIACVLPNLRLALSVLSLMGILSFSVAGFSFPVEDMYPAIGVFAYILPIRYYFLIYINNALNGYDIFFCRWEYIILILFQLLPLTMLWNLKKYSRNPVYIP
jgi:ABC-2 type transport system permease protein